MTDPTPQTTPTRDEAVEAVATAFKRMHSDTCYPSASDGEAKWAAEEIIKAYKAAVDRVNRATDTEIGGIHRSLTSAPAPASGGVDAVATEPPYRPLEDFLDWAGGRWEAEVKNRPLNNVHRRALDTTWRQVIRKLGADPEALFGPAHDDLVEAEQTSAPPQKLRLSADDREIVASALRSALSPAATPVSEAGGERLLRQLRALAVALHAKHYATDAPDWQPLEDGEGILSQIDNMTTGLVRADPVKCNCVRETFAYYLAEAENGLCKIPRRAADDLLQSYVAMEAIVAALAKPASSPAGGVRRVRHKKRGTTYRVLHGAVMQSTHWRDTHYKVPADGRTVVVYQSEDDGSVWVRPSEEFEDGRFEELSQPTSAGRVGE